MPQNSSATIPKESQWTHEARPCCKHTTHVNCIRKEVRSVCDQDDQAALNPRIPPDMRELEQQTRGQSNNKTNRQTAKEDQQEESNTFKQAEYSQLASLICALVVLRCVEQHNGDGIVQDTLAKDDRIELRVDLICVEDRENRDGIRGRESSAD